MVGFDPRKGYDLSRIQYAAAGAVSGLVTRTAVQPLDVVKIRLQLQVDSRAESVKYRGILSTLARISREEGFLALWKGNVPAQVLSISYSVVQFVIFEHLTKLTWNRLPKHLTTEYKPTVHFACGGAAGTLASIVSQPFDVLRTRLVVQGEPKIYRSLLHGAQCILHQEGVTAFYKGLSATLLQVAPYVGLQFGFYALFNGLWENTLHKEHQKDIGWLQSLVCGGVAGACAKASVYPLDMIKKRLQVQGFEKGWANVGQSSSYNGLVDCVVKVAKQEGPRGFFKGLTPSLVKAGAAAGVHFCIYEQFCVLLSGSKR